MGSQCPRHSSVDSSNPRDCPPGSLSLSITHIRSIFENFLCLNYHACTSQSINHHMDPSTVTVCQLVNTMDNLPGPSSSGNPIAPPALQQSFRPPSTLNRCASPSGQVPTSNVIAPPSRQASTPNAFVTPSGQSFTPNAIATPSGHGSTPNALANLSLGQSFPAQRSPAQQPIAEQTIARLVSQAPAQPDAYPNFRDGDVLIISPTGKTWRLHNLILSNASPVIKGILASQEPIHITKRQRAEGQTIKWKLGMIDEPDAEEADPDGLKFKTFKPIVGPHNISMFSEHWNNHDDKKYVLILFRMFTESPLSICPATSMAWVPNHSTISCMTTSSSVCTTSTLSSHATLRTPRLATSSLMPLC